MKLTFPDLPYGESALEPLVSARTLRLHHGSHHRTYFDKTVALVKGTKFENMELDEIVRATAGDAKHVELYHNAGQAWNHDVLWHSMRPPGGGAPPSELDRLIARDFGSQEKLREALHDAAVKQFGSGWAWLAVDGGKLKVSATADADSPMVMGAHVLLAIDVWEHAYYLDYQYKRPDYVEAFVDKLINWDYAAQRLSTVRRLDAA